MKKLIMAASFVCAAVCAHAAALSWASIPVDAEGNEFTGGQSYLIMVTDTANFAVAENLSITGGSIVDSSAISESSSGGAWSTESLTGGEKYYFAVLCTSAGTGDKDSFGNYIMPTSGFFGVDYNGDNTTDSGLYEVTWNGATGGAFEPNYEGEYLTPMSTAVAPEPTSGLLLLLGVAGLALRRRRV